MKTEGVEPSIEVIKAIDEDHAKFLEVCLISIFGRQDLKTGTLLNHTDGDGRTTWSEEQKAEHSARITGQKRSEVTKALMSKSAAEMQEASYDWEQRRRSQEGIDTLGRT